MAVEPDRSCDAPDCDRPLDVADPQLVFQGWLGERRAYECDCGAVTIAATAVPADDLPGRG